jgi:cysteine-rich repeat protein
MDGGMTDPCAAGAKHVRIRIGPLAPDDPSVPSVCGNGVVEGPELCDDGNLVDGDGCAANCESVDPQYSCAKAGACVFYAVCGNATIEANEGCDDGNQVSGDGCSPACVVERDWVCGPMGCQRSVRCGDGVLSVGEQCEPRPDLIGCGDDCKVTPGWHCPTGHDCWPTCGDGLVVDREQCDDGNLVAHDGCSSGCQVEAGWVCADDACLQTICGDGSVEGDEACDTAGIGGLGCTDGCQLQPVCSAEPLQCEELCGDALINGDEQCDDGNTSMGDGCADCMVEQGFQCDVVVDVRVDDVLLQVNPMPTTSKCHPVCGDGIVTGSEACEPEVSALCAADCSLLSRCGDGIIDDDEECDNGMNLDAYYASLSSCAPGCSYPPFCGDGIVDGEMEQCDLTSEFNQGYYGGCDRQCQLTGRCGDGVVQACELEECDDGNRENGDGCDVACMREVNVSVK